MKRTVFNSLLILFIASCSPERNGEQEEKATTLNSLEYLPLFEATELSTTCDTLIKVLQYPHHGLGSVRIDPEGTFLRPEDFVILLKTLKTYDLADSSNVSFIQNKCNDLMDLSWTANNSNFETLSIKRQSFSTYVKDENWEDRGQITIQDFYIYRKNKPNKIYFRVIHQYLTSMNIDGKEYVPNYEYTPEAWEKAEIKLDSVRRICN